MSPASSKTGFRSPPLAYGLWIGALGGLVVSGFALSQWIADAQDLKSLRMADEAAISTLVLDGLPEGHSAAFYELLGERAARLSVPDLYSARQSVREAVRLDPGSAYAWAHLAYLEAAAPDGRNASIEALRQTIALCRDCDPALSLWRIEFIAADWWTMPADLKADAADQLTRLAALPDTEADARALAAQASRLGVPLSLTAE